MFCSHSKRVLLSIDISLKFAVDVYSYGIILYVKPLCARVDTVAALCLHPFAGLYFQRFELLTFGRVKPFDLEVFQCAPSKAARLLMEQKKRPPVVRQADCHCMGEVVQV